MPGFALPRVVSVLLIVAACNAWKLNVGETYTGDVRHPILGTALCSTC